MHLQEPGAMYLETIYLLSQSNPHVRLIDVGMSMGLTKPNVSRAVELLKNDGYVTVDDDGFLSLTEEGLQVAEKLYERHSLLKQYFMAIGVDEETAAEDACKIEHLISEASFEAMKKRANR